MVSSKGNDGTAQKGIAIPAAYKLACRTPGVREGADLIERNLKKSEKYNTQFRI
jgi:hypothetical protein